MMSVIEKYGSTLEENDLKFCKRVWQTPQSAYLNRLKAIGFEGMENVLDAGFGFGQWLVPLAKLNRKVSGVEYSSLRTSIVKEFLLQDRHTIDIHTCSVEDMPFESAKFDAVFSYSVLPCTDYRNALREIYRVLKPNGLFYFNTNGIGWYLYNLFKGHNDTQNFSSREMAIEAIDASISYYANGTFKPGTCLVTPMEIVMLDLEKIGFEIIKFGGEGTINVAKGVEISPFFKESYEGKEGITEYLCTKIY